MATTVLGIKNVSGVGCHLSSAIVILCYSLVPLRNALIHILRCHEQALLHPSADAATGRQVTAPEAVALLELAELLQELIACDGDIQQLDDAVNPARVFAAFESQCNPYELGDATRAVSVLLKTIRSIFMDDKVTSTEDEAVSNSRKKFQALYEHLLGGPTSMLQEIVGTRKAQGEMIVTRRKRKRMFMACPFPIDGSADTSVAGALKDALAAKAAQAYNWDSAADYEESVQVQPSSMSEESQQQSKGEAWITTKQATLCSPFPAYLLLHLRRFECQKNGRIEATGGQLDVPAHLNLAAETKNTDTSYNLIGGILHAEEEGDKDQEDDEGGHYVAVCRTTESSFCLVNDEKVCPIEEAIALDLLAGKPHDLVVPDSPRVMRGVMLVYSSEEASSKTKASMLGTTFEDSLSLLAESGKTILPTTTMTICQVEQSPHDLVGKRLRVRWAKGNFYTGTVTSYNATTGKHSVEYDDGDVREYLLHKKTVQWED
jgi:Ubiquitin carboxyl-terminal hydrolase